MKKILFLLLVTISSYAQTYQNPTFGTVKSMTAPTVSTTQTLGTIESNGTISKIVPNNVPITYTPINYAPSSTSIADQLAGIDSRLGQIGNVTAGVTTRVHLTGDNITVTAGTFFASNTTGKGATAAGTPQQTLSNNDNQKQYFTKDVLSVAFSEFTTAPPGVYSGQLTVTSDPTPGTSKQRFTIEIYKTDNGGTPIASGITGAPVGDLGVTVVAILDSGLINVVAAALTNVGVQGNLASTLTLNTGERLRYHVSAEKVGVDGGAVTMNVYYGSDYNSYYDVPVTFRASTVLNDSGVSGQYVDDALNTLNTLKANDSNVVHKTGDTFVYATDFDDVLSQDPNTKTIEKRVLQPESSRLDPVLAPIYGWGDSLTQGTGGTPYTTTLASLSGFTVTNKGVGGETSTQIKDRMIAEPANYSKSVIIWAGRNNYASPATVKADIATMISALGHTRYLVLGVLNGNYALEYKNSANWVTLTTLNNDLKSLYGNKYVEIREYLVSQHDQTAQDLIDFANDIPPTSLRSDNIHLNTAGYTKVAEYLNQRLGVLYGVNGYLQSKDLKYYTDLFKDTGVAGQVAFWNAPKTQTGTNNFTWDNTNKRLGFGANMSAPATVLQVLDTNGGFFFDGRDLVYNRFKSTGTTTGTSRDLLISAQTSGNTPDLYIHTSGGVSIGNTTNLGVGTLNVTGNISTIAATTANQVPIKSQLDLKADNLLTGYVSGAGIVAGTDTVLQAIQKLNGNDALKALDANVLHKSGNEEKTGSLTFRGIADPDYSIVITADNVPEKMAFKNNQGTNFFTISDAGAGQGSFLIGTASAYIYGREAGPLELGSIIPFIVPNATSNGHAANLGQLNGAMKKPIRTITATTTALVTDYTILCDATSGAITLNLPAAASNTGLVLCFKKINNTANNITIDPNGAQLIDLASTLVVSTYLQSVMIQSDGTGWYKIN